MCGYEMAVPIEPRIVYHKDNIPRMSNSPSNYCEVLVKIDGVKKQICSRCAWVATKMASEIFKNG